MSPLNSKICTGCFIEFDTSNFFKIKSGKYGVHAKCKTCHAKQSIASAKNNPSHKATRAKYYQDNRGSIRSDHKVYYQENKEAISQVNKDWKALNKEKVLLSCYRRKKKILQATPSWLTVEHKIKIESIYWLANDLKAISGEVYHVDHIVPLCGDNVCGLHVPWNLQVLPADINLSKGNKHELAP